MSWEIIHRDYDRDGNLTSFLVLEDGEPTQKNAIPENILLYEHGLKEFFTGENMLDFGDVYAGARDGEGYFIINEGEMVDIPPRMNERFLQTIADILEDNSTPSALQEIHQDIISGQVRRHVVNPLIHTFGEKAFDIQQQSNGWLVEDVFLVDWNANIYTKDDNPEEGDYIREFGAGIVKTDKSYEFIKLSEYGEVPPPETVSLGDNKVTLTKTEMKFLAKVMWLLGRWKYHPDKEFWLNVEADYGI